MWADGSNSGRERITLIKWDLASVPQSALVNKAEIKLHIGDISSGEYNIWAFSTSWSSSGATWNNTSPEQSRSTLIGSFEPDTLGNRTVTLNAEGIQLIQGWVNGGVNYGISIESDGTTNGTLIQSSYHSDSAKHPVLHIEYATPNIELFASSDTYVNERYPNSTYDGIPYMWADGSDSLGYERISLISWDMTSVPQNVTVNKASVKLYIDNVSTGAYNIWAFNTSWSSSSATWNNTLPEQNRGVLLGSFIPNISGEHTVNLGSDGTQLVQQWIDGGNNFGISVESAGTSNGTSILGIDQIDTAKRPRLSINY